jgi:hypothetical protein
MENWLSCTISSGQFAKEFGVDGHQFNGRVFSLFVPGEVVEYRQAPTKEQPTPGWVRVEVLEIQGDLVLVRLPRETFQNGAFITVKAEQLRTPPSLPRRTKKPRNGPR